MPIIWYIHIYVCMLDRYVKAYISGLCLRYSGIVTVHPWQTETDKPYCNNEFLCNMVIIFKTIPDELKQYLLTRGNE